MSEGIDLHPRVDALEAAVRDLTTIVDILVRTLEAHSDANNKLIAWVRGR